MKLLGALVLVIMGGCADDESIHDIVTCNDKDPAGKPFTYRCERVCRDIYITGVMHAPDGTCLGVDADGTPSVEPGDYYTLTDGTKGYCTSDARDGEYLFVFLTCED